MVEPARQHELPPPASLTSRPDPDQRIEFIADTVRSQPSAIEARHHIGRLSQVHRAASIELYGREVIPRVRELLEDASVERLSSDQRSAGNARSRV
jgi:hypothetical protein